MWVHLPVTMISSVVVVDVVIDLVVVVAKEKGKYLKVITQVNLLDWDHLPVTLELPISFETVTIDKETTPTQLTQRQIKTNRRSLELVVVGMAELKQHFGISVPLTNAMAKARGFF